MNPTATHHKHGEMALSFAMHYIEENNLATLTNYGRIPRQIPPHLASRGRRRHLLVLLPTASSAGAQTAAANGGKPGWNQQWRAPLRAALDFLRDNTAPLAEKLAGPLLTDFWAARDAYIHVVLARESEAGSSEAITTFLDRHATRPLTSAERTTVLELMELERHTQLMYTSCGWFFDEISGIETVQIIAYAGRVLQLSCELIRPSRRRPRAPLPRPPRRSQTQRPRTPRRLRHLHPLRHRHEDRP